MIILAYAILLILFVVSFVKTLIFYPVAALICLLWEYNRTGAPRDGMTNELVFEQIILHYIGMLVTWPIYFVEGLKEWIEQLGEWFARR